MPICWAKSITAWQHTDSRFASLLLLRVLLTPSESKKWWRSSLKEIINLDWKLKELKTKFNFSLSLGEKKKMEAAKFALHRIAQAQ